MTRELVRLPADLVDELNDCSEAEDRPMAAIIRLALRKYLTDTSGADAAAI
ncbi:MAG TPA: ribbon-helix-helix protein, CopG family [Acidimicrobiales bacterium]|nr:ribbon-helix-helix protein, CopG family [Acidimicrobiales bacterium]